MRKEKRVHPKEKSKLHPRSKHRERYNFRQLTATNPDLKRFVKVNEYDDETINFFDPLAVKELNKSLLMKYYRLHYWEIPDGYLCPPIPGRADYIHNLADLLCNTVENKSKKIPTGEKINCLDIGVGANCVYPLIGSREYKWTFVGADIDPVALDAAQLILDNNPPLSNFIELRQQVQPKDIFKNIIEKDDRFDLTLCNPPFHSSAEEAAEGSRRKVKNLTGKKHAKPQLNFGGMSNELWCKGGEQSFIEKTIMQSRAYGNQCLWFTTLVSKNSTLDHAYRVLRKVNCNEFKTINMGQGNKVSRIVAWTFHNKESRKAWVNKRWKK